MKTKLRSLSSIEAATAPLAGLLLAAIAGPELGAAAPVIRRSSEADYPSARAALNVDPKHPTGVERDRPARDSAGGKVAMGVFAAALVGGANAGQAETLPAHQGTRLLKSGKLVVEIDDPAAAAHNRYNRDARRFSPVAMVLRAQFDGKEYFYSPLDGGAYDRVGGAPMEFDLGENVMNKPPGFAEAVERATNGSGDFLKIGVGILRKDNSVYRWEHDYPAVELAATQATWDARGDQVTFRQTLTGTANGYAYELEETLQVRDPKMIMQYRLRNTGRKRFTTEQYLHNFLVFADQAVGPHYEVHLPYHFQLQGDPGPAIRRTPGQDVLEFWKAVPSAVKFRVTTPPGYSGPNALTVTQTDVGQSLGIEASLPSQAVDLWCTDRQLSPEMLVAVALDPGQEKQWTRTYTFKTRKS